MWRYVCYQTMHVFFTQLPPGPYSEANSQTVCVHLRLELVRLRVSLVPLRWGFKGKYAWESLKVIICHPIDMNIVATNVKKIQAVVGMVKSLRPCVKREGDSASVKLAQQVSRSVCPGKAEMEGLRCLAKTTLRKPFKITWQVPTLPATSHVGSPSC